MNKSRIREKCKTNPYGYTECRDCHASHDSKVNPLNRCCLDCTKSSYGLCPADCRS